MAKYSKKLVSYICSLIKSDSYTIDTICSLSGISRSTYHEWKNTKPDFSDKIREAEEDRLKYFAVEAKKSLLKKITGFTFIENKTISNSLGIVKEQTITEKYFPPDTPAIIFALTNTEGENWKNKVNNEVTGKDGKDLMQGVDLSKLSDSELSEYHKLIQKASGK